MWPEAESGGALWCLRRTEADEAVRAAAYGDGLVAAHAAISLRLAKQAAENNVHLNKTVTWWIMEKEECKKTEKESAAHFWHSGSFVVVEAARNRILANAAKSNKS